MTILLTVVMGLAYLATLQAREALARCDREFQQLIRSCTRYHRNPRRTRRPMKPIDPRDRRTPATSQEEIKRRELEALEELSSEPLTP